MLKLIPRAGVRVRGSIDYGPGPLGSQDAAIDKAIHQMSAHLYANEVPAAVVLLLPVRRREVEVDVGHNIRGTYIAARVIEHFPSVSFDALMGFAELDTDADVSKALHDIDRATPSDPNDVLALTTFTDITPWFLTDWNGSRYYLHQARVYADVHHLKYEDVRALCLAMDRRVQRTIERAHHAVTMGDAGMSTREAIADDVKLFVWQRDGGRCVRCGSNENLEFDHIIPLIMGGANTARNHQLLCEPCNRLKGGNLV